MRRGLTARARLVGLDLLATLGLVQVNTGALEELLNISVLLDLVAESKVQ